MDSVPPPEEPLSRRSFLVRLSFLGGGVVLLGGPGCSKCGSKPTSPPQVLLPAPEGSSLLTFSEAEYAVVAAAAERVLPKDGDPGALDANVPAYIDRALQAPELAQMRRDFLQGVAALERRAHRMFQAGFAQATAAQQDELLAIFKDSPPGSGEAHFFELLVVLTLEGFLGDPSYGGNKNGVGWALVGFDAVGTVAASPPEGHDGINCLRTCGRHE
jgi:gluconate 2-dehydrogenase gamma chain